MKVSLATQVLSHSVAAAVRTYVSFHKMDEAALSTANFVDQVDKLFDILNSRFQQPNHKWKKPLSKTSEEQFKLLDDAIAWIAGWRFQHVTKKTVKHSLPFQQGLLLTVRAIRLLADDLLNRCEFKYVFTSRFNQDIVENWFSCIRQKGLNNDSRTAWEYESAGRAITINWMLGVTSKTANCEIDFDYFIGVMAHFCTQKKSDLHRSESGVSTSTAWTAPSAADLETSSAAAEAYRSNSEMCEHQVFSAGDMECSFAELPVTDWSQAYQLTPTDDSVVCYLAGYAMKKARERINCQHCTAAYELSSLRSQDQLYHSGESRLAFISFKTYDWARHGLLAPSQELYELCAGVERVIQMSIEKLSCGRNVSQNLKECVMASVDISSYHIDSVCDEHQKQQGNYILSLLIRVRIHHYIRIRNRELQQLSQAHKLKVKVNRKAKKVMNK